MGDDPTGPNLLTSSHVNVCKHTSALVVLSSLADPGFLSTLLVSFYLLLFSFTITDTDTYSTGEPYRGVVCEDTRGLTLVRVPRGSHPWNP